MDRPPGLSVRLKLTLSYAGFLMVAGTLLLAAVWLFLLRYVPDRAVLVNRDAVVRRPQAPAFHLEHDHQRRRQQRDVHKGHRAALFKDER